MKHKIKYENKEIEFELIRKKRKTIAIKIDEFGNVIISAPLRVNKEYILQVAREKAIWINEKQKEILKRASEKPKRDFSPNSTFMYLGEEYKLQLCFSQNIKDISIELDLITKKFIIKTNTLNIESLKYAMEKWYRIKTLDIVTGRIEYYSKNFKDKVTEIKVKEQKKRWASCTWKNSILFNWRCSMAKDDVIDYIVVHEMCHMEHRNHSKLFWNRVSEIMPDYKVKHQWLRDNGSKLFI